MRPSLSVLVDGAPLPEDEARALWERFSAWMEEHRGDLGGFATSEGFASIHPDVDGGRPVLRASRTEAQRPYAPVSRAPDPPPRPRASAGGSVGRHSSRPRDRSDPRTPKK